MLRQTRRCLTALVHQRRTGFVFDLDGVLLKGQTLIPGADLAVQRVDRLPREDDSMRPLLCCC